jgi:hypothetical protein
MGLVRCFERGVEKRVGPTSDVAASDVYFSNENILFVLRSRLDSESIVFFLLSALTP